MCQRQGRSDGKTRRHQCVCHGAAAPLLAQQQQPHHKASASRRKPQTPLRQVLSQPAAPGSCGGRQRSGAALQQQAAVGLQAAAQRVRLTVPIPRPALANGFSLSLLRTDGPQQESRTGGQLSQETEQTGDRKTDSARARPTGAGLTSHRQAVLCSLWALISVRAVAPAATAPGAHGAVAATAAAAIWVRRCAQEERTRGVDTVR